MTMIPYLAQTMDVLQSLLSADPEVQILVFFGFPIVLVAVVVFFWQRSMNRLSGIVEKMVEGDKQETETQIERERAQAKREDRLIASLEKLNDLWEDQTQISKTQTDANIKSAASSEASARAVAELAQNMSEIRQGQNTIAEASKEWRAAFDQRLETTNQTIANEALKLRQSIDGLSEQIKSALATPNTCADLIPKVEKLIDDVREITNEFKSRTERETKEVAPAEATAPATPEVTPAAAESPAPQTTI